MPARGAARTTQILKTVPTNLASKKGSGGKAVTLRTNYFSLRKKPNWSLYQYRVDMSPNIDYTKERKYHVAQNKDLNNIWFDGTILLSVNALVPQGEKLIFCSKRRDGDDVKITVRLVGEIDPSSIQYLQFLNIVLKNVMGRMNLDMIGRNFYDKQAAVRDPKLMKHKLELYPGYQTSIRQHEDSILLGVEITHKILRTETVHDMITKMLSQIKKGAARDPIQDKLDKLLIGQIVITKYNNKTYKITEIRMDMNPTSEFEDTKGNKIRFCDYYLKRWGDNGKITDLSQPLIVSIPKEKGPDGRTKPPIQLVPELCFMTGLSEEQRSDFNMMRDLGVYTRLDPANKAKSLLGFAKRLNETPDITDVLRKWDLKFGNELQKVPARLLDPEVILGQGSNKATYQSSNADWTRNLSRWTCTSIANMKKWVIIYPSSGEEIVSNFKKELKSVFPGIGMTFHDPQLVPINNRMGDYKAALDKWLPKRPEMVMVFVPSKTSADLYGMIKKTCCVENPVPSQVVALPTVRDPKKVKSVATKVALQLNCKLGGELWTVAVPLKDVMVAGFDTYHDSQQKGRSVGALVCSINKSLTKYHSNVEFHSTDGAQEVSAKICTMLSKSLQAYSQANNSLPTRIILYRDGVGDGQIPVVLATEVTAIKEAISHFNKDIKLTFIIVSKRINTKFFAEAGQTLSNPMSGTVVDDVVTLPERYDFYLVSQSVRQGTVCPTSYNVITDECGLRPEHLQKLSYKLTHLYYNWPGTVRVPAPVQYAHKLAYLVGTSIHTQPAPGLGNLLYFL